jgi:ubiquinone/menaquinone biosynthesis C-methylase UbiE
MIEKARTNAEKLGFHNIEFRQGDIEKLPVTSNLADVVVSNCVLNLVPDKQKAYNEVFRALKPGGHFSISDVVLDGELPAKLLQAAEMYAGCVSGAISKEQYINTIKEAGFINISIQKQKAIIIPDDILKNYLSEAEMKSYKESSVGIFSITVYGEKEMGCCKPGCCN